MRVRGILKEIYVRNISTLQLKKRFRKGCELYATLVLDTLVLDLIEDKSPKLEDHLVLQYFKDVFLDEVSGFPPKRDINFTIDLAPRVALVFKAPYIMST